jgi:acetyltransferase-like isoleucine patch superfamily enzyme
MVSQESEVNIGEAVIIGEDCKFGFPTESKLLESDSLESVDTEPVSIDNNCILMNDVILCEGVKIGQDTILQDRTRVGPNSQIGDGCRLLYGAWVDNRVTISDNCRISGFICDDVIIESNCTVMGHLVHEYTQPFADWWEVDNDPPTVKEKSVIAYGSMIVGDITIGPKSYVAAGAVVTKDVPERHIAVGTNEFISLDDWKGGRLELPYE